MSRRRRATQRAIEPDPVYHSITIAKFINKVMKNGKKSLAQKIVYRSLERFAKEVEAEDLREAFSRVMENAMPILEVKSRRIGGATYQVPIEVSSNRRMSMAMKWLITYAREKVGRDMIAGLSMELVDCYRNQGATVKKKEEVHRMAKANRAFSHYAW